MQNPEETPRAGDHPRAILHHVLSRIPVPRQPKIRFASFEVNMNNQQPYYPSDDLQLMLSLVIDDFRPGVQVMDTSNPW